MRALASLALLLPGACGGAPAPLAAGGYDVAIAHSLADGDYGRAEDFVRRALLQQPVPGSVHLWAATVAEIGGRPETAAEHLREALRTPDRGGLDETELRGRLGDLLFRHGRYGEAAPQLFAGAVGPEANRRRAFAELATLLPPLALTPRGVATEVALREGQMPELFCRFDQAERPFVIDTGASYTTLSRTLATELGVVPLLPAGTGHDGSGRPIPIAAGLVRAFGLGEIHLGLRPVLVVDDQLLAMQDLHGGPERAPLGVIGMDVLGQFRITFQPGRASIGIATPRGLAPNESVPCLRVEGSLLVPVHVEARDLWFVLDTGASESTLTEAGLQMLTGGTRRAEPAFRRVRTPGGGGYAVREVRGLILVVSEVRFTSVTLPVVDRQSTSLMPVHGVLGSDLLLRCRTVLDGGRLRIEAP